eukprot:COSAG04_NODE_9578_length_850_cov_1.756325_2_plen_135_part_01
MLPARLCARLPRSAFAQRLACRPCVRAASSTPPPSSNHAGGHHDGGSRGGGDGLRMPVIVDVMIVPSDVGEPSLSKHVAAAVQAFSDNPSLKVQSHPMGTLLEGDWDDVLGAVKMATVQLHAEGVARVTSVLKVG